MTYLFCSSGTVIHKHQGGEDVGSQPHHRDKVRSDPGRDPSHQPLPVVLHHGLQQGAASTAVSAGTNSTTTGLLHNHMNQSALPSFMGQQSMSKINNILD